MASRAQMITNAQLRKINQKPEPRRRQKRKHNEDPSHEIRGNRARKASARGIQNRAATPNRRRRS